jgi:phage-related minor tail protein
MVLGSGMTKTYDGTRRAIRKAMLKRMMKKVWEWSERVEAQASATAECNVTIWKRRLANCEESLKRNVGALLEAEKGQAELRKALKTKDAELATVRAELDAERRIRTSTEKLLHELREAQTDFKSLRHRNGVLRGDVDEARWNE